MQRTSQDPLPRKQVQAPRVGPAPRAPSAKPVPLRKLPILTPIVVVWSISAMLSASYLAVLAVAPEWLGDLTPAASRTVDTAKSTSPSETENRLVAEVSDLRAEIKALNTRLADVRRETETVKSQVSDEVGALKAAFAGQPETPVTTEVAVNPVATTAAGSATVPPPLRRPATAPPSPRVPAGSVSATEPTALNTTGSVVPKVINGARGQAAAPTSANVETGSVTTSARGAQPAPAARQNEPVTFGAPIVTRPVATQPVSSSLGVVISNADTVDGLRLSWSALTDRYGSELGGLQPRYMLSTDPSAGSFDLVAGPIRSQADADDLCRKMQAQKLSCRVGSFAGNAL